MTVSERRPHRLDALRRAMAAAGLDAVALVPGANFQYVTGGRFGTNERPIVLIIPAEGEARIVLPVLEGNSWTALDFAARIYPWQDADGYDAAFRAAADGLALRRLGVEGQGMRVFVQIALARHFPDVELVDAQKAISAIRLRKDATEIAALRRAIALSETALEQTLAAVRIGMSEREIQGLLIGHLFAGGADALSFSPIVATGGKAAEPHAHAGDEKVKRGDVLLFDFGGSVDGFSADITRTVFVGEADAESREFYETVLAANRLGHATARAGVTAHAVDDAVLSLLEGSRFGDFVIHKTGHGLGLDIHEDPYIMRGNHQVLEPGMVFTIEPGLYAAGRIGVRIEDDVVVTETGVDSLTSFPRDLRIVG